MSKDTDEKAKKSKEEAQQQPQPSLNLISQYIRDLSFENIAAQKRKQLTEKPQINITINVGTNPVADSVHEVALKIGASAKIKEDTIFLLEVDYCGHFSAQNFPQESLEPLLLIECPRLLFPFARRIVADLTRDGGFIPLMIDPIDFAGLYRHNLEARAGQKHDAEKSNGKDED